MILYLAGSEGEKSELLKRLSKSNLLFSYIGNPSNVISIPHDSLNSLSLVDSGAFSAWTKDTIIDVDKYIEWLNQNDSFIDLFGQVDVIPGNKDEPSSWKDVKDSAEKTWKNYLYMRNHVVNPEKLLYTFHVGEPKEFLIRALKWKDSDGRRIPYMALGGLVGKSKSIRRNFLNMCFNLIKCYNPSVKIHTFGMTDLELLEEFPITSADSTRWIVVGIKGRVFTDMGEVMVLDSQKYESTHYLQLFNNDELMNKFDLGLKKFGFTVTDLIDSRDNRIVYNGLWMMDKFSKIKYKRGNIKKSLF